MSLISSLQEPANVVIAGANGGIGGALVDALSGDERVGRLWALSRSPLVISSSRVRPIIADVTDEQSLEAVANRCAEHGRVDLVIVATGILHRGDDIRPEKRMADLDGTMMAEVFRINAIAPALIAKHFLPLMRRDAKTAFAAISARVGSIGDNRLGGWTAYRASKAALNMIIRTLSIEHARSHPEGLVVTLHPGTTDTNLSKPFQRNVPREQLFSPQFAAHRLLEVIDQRTCDDTGGFFAWDGDIIEY
jgi:NAD(P)-dependent dehydrogenase (short-subunit alcohol dehydrogenase family)